MPTPTLPAIVVLPLAVMLVTPVSAPLTFPVPSKLCPQIVREFLSLVAEATLESINANCLQAFHPLPP